jgi:hypothetical protein
MHASIGSVITGLWIGLASSDCKHRQRLSFLLAYVWPSREWRLYHSKSSSLTMERRWVWMMAYTP